MSSHRIATAEEIRAMSTDEYLQWLEDTGQDVDQFDLADEAAANGEVYEP